MYVASNNTTIIH